MITVAIHNGVGIWDDCFPPLVTTPNEPTQQVGVNNLRGYYSTEWGYIFAGVALAALSVLAYRLLTMHFIRGLSAGAVKG